MASNKENKCDTNLDFDKFTVIQLKDHLCNRGEYVSGNKEELDTLYSVSICLVLCVIYKYLCH